MTSTSAGTPSSRSTRTAASPDDTDRGSSSSWFQFGTAIVTSAFAVGDTLHASILDEVRTRLGPIDEIVLVHRSSALPDEFTHERLAIRVARKLKAIFAAWRLRYANRLRRPR